MAKLFISQPMRGRSNEEIKAERGCRIEHACCEEYEITTIEEVEA